MYKFFIPFYYMFHTRYRSILDKVSWLIIYFVPVAILVYHFTSIEIIPLTFIYIITISILFNSYELGYIQNDVQTIKKETNPTIRLNKKELLFFNIYYRYLMVYKVFITVILLVLLQYINTYYKTELNIHNLIYLITALIIIFFIHNTIRNKFNILTFFHLLSLKYLIPIIYIINLNSMEIYLGVLFIFPIPRTIEHATKTKYGQFYLQNFIKNHDLFRVKYYFIFSVLLLVLYRDITNIFFLLSLYFLIYRVGILIILNLNIYRRKR